MKSNPREPSLKLLLTCQAMGIIIELTYKECVRDKPVDRTATCQPVRC